MNCSVPWFRREIAAILIALGISGAVSAHPLEKGLVISDPLIVEALEKRGFAFSTFIATQLDQQGTCEVQPIVSKAENPFQHYPLCRVAETLRTRVQKAQSQTLDEVARTSAGKGTLFPTDFFKDKDATVTLVGVVNRMDRAYRPSRHRGEIRASSCGEIRLIYRFGYRETKDRETVQSRLPLTLNLVLRARRPGQQEDCATIARRWLDYGSEQPSSFVGTRAEADRLAIALVKNGPLALVNADHVDRLELNMQIMRLPALTKQDFGTHAEYLLTVFNWDLKHRIFIHVPLENQIDRNLGLKDTEISKSSLRRRLSELKRELFSDAAIADLDSGRLIIPEKYLAMEAISVAPGGESRSQNGSVNVFLGSDDECSKPDLSSGKLCISEIARVLQRYEKSRGPLKTVKSANGFIARLNDVSCSGCHQTRSVAGFHFTGADIPEAFSANAVFVPGSPHLFGDLPRRAEIVRQIANGRNIDGVNFARGFSARPERRFSVVLSDTTLFDGWGAACDLEAGKAHADKSFADWTCSNGLTCKPYMPSVRNPTRGICMNTDTRVGDMLETGVVTHARYGNDLYTRRAPNLAQAYGGADTSLDLVGGEPLGKRLKLPERPAHSRFVAAQQMGFVQRQTGGFPGGMLRTECCENLPSEATCGMVAVDGFNTCLDRKPFTACFREHVNYAGLRACDAATPCREDYICLRPMLGKISEFDNLVAVNRQYSCQIPDKSWLKRAEMGTCIPPYFVLQFRADKHQAGADGESMK